jgi:hypothetical protein
MATAPAPKRDGFARVGYAIAAYALLRLTQLALAAGSLEAADWLAGLARAAHRRAFPNARG